MLLDFYVLATGRSKEASLNFLDRFIPKRKKASVDYPIPQYSSEPLKTIVDDDELIKYLEEIKNEPYSIYWNNGSDVSKIRSGMLFYTDDGNVIFGLSCEGILPLTKEIKDIFKEFIQSVGSEYYCITSEEVPPENSRDFIEFSKQRGAVLTDPDIDFGF